MVQEKRTRPSTTDHLQPVLHPYPETTLRILDPVMVRASRVVSYYNFREGGHTARNQHVFYDFQGVYHAIERHLHDSTRAASLPMAVAFEKPQSSGVSRAASNTTWRTPPPSSQPRPRELQARPGRTP